MKLIRFTLAVSMIVVAFATGMHADDPPALLPPKIVIPQLEKGSPEWKRLVEKRRKWFQKKLAEQAKKDPEFVIKLMRAREKARKMTLKVHGPVRRGWCHKYFPIERMFVQQECGINWWMTPPELNPEIIYD